MKFKRGLSPIVATALLIVLVFVLAMIIFIWARSFIGEQIEKFGEPVDRACDRVNFEVDFFDDGSSYDQGEFVNLGDVPIYNFEIKKISGGNSETESFSILDDGGFILDAGSSKTGSFDFGGDISDPEEIIIYPRILGGVKGKKTSQAYTCLDKGIRKQL